MKYTIYKIWRWDTLNAHFLGKPEGNISCVIHVLNLE